MKKERVLITGSSRGIGLALAEEFAANGWDVVATARRPGNAELSALARRHPAVTVQALDVCDDTSVAACAAAVAGPVDLLVNNAAVFPGEGDETLERLDPQWFAEAFETNVTGVVRVVRAFLPRLRQSSQGRIVNISSGAGSIGSKDDFAYYPYAASKAALNMLTRAMAVELRAEGIVCVALSPGWVRTEMGGPHAPLDPAESAKSLFRTTVSLTMAQSGLFLGRDGEPYEW